MISRRQSAGCCDVMAVERRPVRLGSGSDIPLAAAIRVMCRVQTAGAVTFGKGRIGPAPSSRFNVSRNVEGARPRCRAISRVDILAKNFKRMISRA